MKTQRKPRRLNIDSIITEMPVIEGELLRSIVGGYDNDCFWRCIAYIKSGGTSYSEADAARYAEDFFEGKVENEGAMTTEQMRGYVNDYYSGSNGNDVGRHVLMQFDPSKAPESVLSGEMSHVVVFKEYKIDENGSYIINVFDPQHGSSYNIPLESVMHSFVINNDSGSGGSNSGESSYSGSDSHGSNTSSGSSGVGVGSEGCYTPSGY